MHSDKKIIKKANVLAISFTNHYRHNEFESDAVKIEKFAALAREVTADTEDYNKDYNIIKRC